MAFKINVSSNGKTYKLETENENLIGKKIGETIDGIELNQDLIKSIKFLLFFFFIFFSFCFLFSKKDNYIRAKIFLDIVSLLLDSIHIKI